MGRNVAFTLVELAIVLVIIGLLVGGVLVGQDLIRSAATHSVISMLDQFNVAANTFRVKYDGIPGDIISTRANSAGISYVIPGVSTIQGWGDGNGVIESGVTSLPAHIDLMSGETTLFWHQLGQTQLIPTQLNGITCSTACGIGGTELLGPTSSTDFVPYLPQLKIRDAAFVYVMSVLAKNYFYISKFIQSTGSGSIGVAGVGQTAPILQVQEAQAIDSKLDDGMPATGSVIAATWLPASLPTGLSSVLDAGAASATGVCVNSTPSPPAYNLAYKDEVDCRLLVRTSF